MSIEDDVKSSYSNIKRLISAEGDKPVQNLLSEMRQLVGLQAAEIEVAKSCFVALDIHRASLMYEALNRRQDRISDLKNLLMPFGLDTIFKAEMEKIARDVEETLAEIDLLIAMRAAGVSEELQRRINSFKSPDSSEAFQQIKADIKSRWPEIAGSEDTAYVNVYVRSVVGWRVMDDAIKSGDDIGISSEDLEAMTRALVHFHHTAFTPNYAPDGLNLRDRIVYGAEHYERLSKAKRVSVGEDLDLFIEKLPLHEWSREDAEMVHAASAKIVRIEKSNHEGIALRVREIERVISGYSRGPLHLEALDQQFKTYKGLCIAASRVTKEQDEHVEAKLTRDALKIATAYCWSSTCIDAVSSAATSLPADVEMSDEILGELAGVGGGWWWFETPLQIQTQSRPAKTDPVTAMLWCKTTIDGEPSLWFSAFVPPFMSKQHGQSPSTSWAWPYGVKLSDLEIWMRAGYRDVNVFGLPYVSSGVDVTVSAAVRLSSLFVAGTAWMKQRIVTTDRAKGVRNIVRATQREHKLNTTPEVRVVHLRRREPSRQSNDDVPSTARVFSVKWVVHGHWRDQWYPSSQKHAPKWISPYIKGPDDKPLKDSKRVFAVVR